MLLVDLRQATLLTDGRYTIQAKSETAAVRVRIVRKSPLVAAGEMLRRGQARRLRVGFPPERLTVLQHAQLQQAVDGKVRWVKSPGIVETLRCIKDESELTVMREAAILAGRVWESMMPKVKPGVSEMELAAEIDYRLRLEGASGPSFETIVASGERAALPHARPSPRLIGKNELVVFDLGAILRGYCSDITRTVYVGRAPEKVRSWYQAVLEAHESAHQSLKPGIEAEAVDARARGVLKRHGLGAYFTHSTGHGLGIEVHEPPRIGRGDKTRLAAGNVVTIEPGVYVENVGGIRIEDDFHVHQGGAELISSAKRDFLEL